MFEKHLAGRGGPAELLPRGSWASGNAAARAGLDMRLFYQVRAALPLRAGAEHLQLVLSICSSLGWELV